MYNNIFKAWLIHQIVDVHEEGVFPVCWIALLYVPDTAVTHIELCKLDSTSVTPLL